MDEACRPLFFGQSVRITNVSATIDEKLIRHIAHLSRLTLNEQEVAALAAELNKIIGFIDQLSMAATEGVEPAASAMSIRNVWREDVQRESFDPETALMNAPASEGDFFRVPKILETEEPS